MSLLSRKGLERLDLLLLVVESIDLNGSQSMLYLADQLGLQSHLPNLVEIWKKRCTNPLRKTNRGSTLSSPESDALILLICTMAERVYPVLRQLISSREPKSLSIERWNIFHDRFTDLIIERMNIRRAAVKKLLEPELSKDILYSYVITLSMCCGKNGYNRLRENLIEHSI
tara:strand:- start:2720 stop:3232 length:513 start_codon:yes stop_codon:yes gene_type:complete